MAEIGAALDSGQPLDRQALLKKYSDVADELEKCLEQLDFIQSVGPCLGDRLQQSQLCTVELGDFRIVREIGRGGMGVVYEAQQVSMGRRVALKVLPFASLLDDRQLQRFKNEARTAGTLHHPHVVPVYSVGVDRGVHYYAMQFVDGPSLAEVLKGLRSELRVASKLQPANVTSKPRSSESPQPQASGETRQRLQAMISTARSSSRTEYFRTVAQWGLQAANALAYAHANGVLHRDIKPGNLLLDNSQHLWITDFGLARLQDDRSITRTGDLLGTVQYMAPEQALGKRVLVDHRADIYSLGVTLYESLTLTPAFSGEDREELLRQVAFDEPRPLRRIEHSVPEELETIVLKSIEKNPQDRYSSADELRDDLQRFLNNEPIQARPPTVVRRVTKWARAHMEAVSAFVITVLISLILGSVLVGRAYHAERNQRQIAEQERLQARLSLRVAKDAVDTMYVKVADQWLQHRDHLTTVQQELLTRAANFYERLADNEIVAWEDRLSMAEMQLRLASTYKSLGRMPESRSRYENAIDSLQQLLAASPNSAASKLALASAYGGLEDVTKDRSRRMELLRMARELASEASADMPNNHRAWSVYFSNTLGWGLIQTEVQQARSVLHEALRIAKERASIDSSDRSQHDLALAYFFLGGLPNANETQRLYFQSAAGIWRSLYPRHPEHSYIQSMLPQCLRNLANTYVNDDPVEALRLYEEAAAYAADMLARGRGAAGAREVMTGIANNMHVLCNLFARDGNEELIDRVIVSEREIVEALRASPEELQAIASLLASSASWASLMEANGQLKGAKQIQEQMEPYLHHVETIKYDKLLYVGQDSDELKASEAAIQRVLISVAQIARSFTSVENRDAASRAFKVASDIVAYRDATVASDKWHSLDIAQVHHHLAEAHQELQQWQDVIEQCDLAAQHLDSTLEQGWQDRVYDESQLRRQLAYVHKDRGFAKFQIQEFAEATKDCEQSAHYYEGLLDEFDTQSKPIVRRGLQENLYWVSFIRSSCAYFTGDQHASKQAFDKCLTTLRDLLRDHPDNVPYLHTLCGRLTTGPFATSGFEEALSAAKQAVDLQPANEFAWYSSAFANYRLGRNATAVSSFRRFVDSEYFAHRTGETDSTLALLGLAIAMHAEGQDGAREYLDRAIGMMKLASRRRSLSMDEHATLTEAAEMFGVQNEVTKLFSRQLR